MTGFDPVLLDLSDARNMYVMIVALDEFTKKMERAALEEEQAETCPELEDGFGMPSRTLAAHARALGSDVERQLDRNAEIRRTFAH